MAEIWGAVAVVGGSIIGGAMSSAASSKASKKAAQNTANEDELNFQRQDWLAQQQRLWQLQDRQYKQQAIAGFKGQWGAGGDIKPPNQDAAMGGLLNFDPNKLGSVNGAAAPAPAPSPLAQLRPQPVGTRP